MGERFRKKLFRSKNPDPIYESERLPLDPPFSCPRCSSRIELSPITDNWQCVGLTSRAEVEKYLAPEFPKGKVPESVTAKPSCGWLGAAAEHGKTWL